MKKILIGLLILTLQGAKTFALEIVYPKTNPCTINASSTFFIGSTNPTDKLKINGIDVKVSPTGGFAQVVPLNVGENKFNFEWTEETYKPLSAHCLPFTIIRPQPAAIKTPQPLIEYPVMNFHTIKDNVPIRTTPVDGGINRMTHLPAQMELLINGEQNGFYRVYLNSKTIGWIDKQNLENSSKYNLSPILIKKAKCKMTKENYIYEFELEQPVPFVVREENGITFELFNVKNMEDNTFKFNQPLNKIYGWDAYYEGSNFVLKIRRQPILDCAKPLKNRRIVIDAGHGGKEVGAIGCSGTKEKDINLEIAKNLEEELKNRGANVFMTRKEDIDVSLADRVKFAKEKDAEILISIHANALPDGADPNKNKGTSVYYYHNQAKPLAESILESITTKAGTQNDKVRQGSLALVRPTSSVSVLIEVAYMINPDDYALLTDKCFQLNCAKAIADGIENYLLK